MSDYSNTLVDFKVPVKLKLSALWVSVMFCYIYGDFFFLFAPGKIESMMNGTTGVGSTTPVKLLLFAVLMSIPSLMVFLSLLLKPAINRWTNIVTGLFFTAIMILVVTTSLGRWMIFYTYLGIVEIIITSMIVYLAWHWPKNQVEYE